MTKSFTVGILGGGQLARMTANAAFQLGIDIAIWEKFSNSPAGRITPLEIVGSWEDKTLLKKFTEQVDVITLENEFIDAKIIRQIEDAGTVVYPSSACLAQVQDKLTQKQLLSAKGIQVTPFSAIETVEDATIFGKHHGFPFLLKTRRNGYDGYGNITVHDTNEIHSAMMSLGFPSIKLIAEAFVYFEKELATNVLRTPEGKMQCYPIVQSMQQQHICKWIKAPIDLPFHLHSKAEQIALQAIQTIDGVGVFGVEMFLTKDQQILLNELAPRPHNSGHYTMDACVTSQFENHLRAILNWPLGSTEMKSPAAIMMNILGTHEGTVEINTLRQFLQFDGRIKLHWYGKVTSRIGRKMGHLTVCGNSLAECEELFKPIENMTINWQNENKTSDKNGLKN